MSISRLDLDLEVLAQVEAGGAEPAAGEAEVGDSGLTGAVACSGSETP